MADVAQAFSNPAPDMLTVTWSGIDADADAPTAAMILLLWVQMMRRGRPPDRMSVSVDRSVGANAFDLDIQGSVRNDSDWADVFTETTPDTPVGTDLSTHAYEFWRFLVTTVGVGNTLIIFVTFIWD